MLKALNKFFEFSGTKNKRKFYLSILLGVALAFLEALRIPAAFIMIKAVLEKNVTGNHILASAGIMLFSIVVSVLVKNKSTMLQTEGGYETCANKRIEIAEHMRYLPMGYFNSNSLGYITSVTTNTMENLADVATRVVMMTTQGFLATLLIAITMLFFDYRIGLIVLIGFVVYLGVNSMLQKYSGTIAHKKDEADSTMVDVVLEYIQGMAEIKAYSIAGESNKKLTKAIEECEKVNMGLEWKCIPLMTLQNFITKMLGVLTCIVSLYLYTNGNMELPICVMMLVCSFMLYASLDTAGSFSALLRHVETAVDKANKVLGLETMDVEGKDIQPENYEIEFKNVEFSYEQRKIIDGVSLRIKEGTTTAIVGPSGGGKTTLCNLMARFWDVQKGCVKLGGIDVKKYSIDSLMKNFSFVFQRVYLFEDTIANNIRFGQPDASMEQIVEAAKKACCHEFIMKLPNGYDTIIGEGGASLSGGEKQRISIARAIMKNAPIIILDEATANVDPENEKDLVSAIDALTKEKTIIMIAHRLKTVRNADNILVVDRGKIVEQGKHEELMARGGIYRRFVNSREIAGSWKLMA
ncbi:MAG: ABC transporter ATP-binding protein [Lachnospiraceae bacterium]|nr:ABC transporter ATP-binding protein [Lachnospiraceae bacterium]